MIDYRIAAKDDLQGILDLYRAWAEEKQTTGHDIDTQVAEVIWQEAADNGVSYFIAKDGASVISACYISIIPNLTWF
jgi:hypothetical protein